MWKLPFEFLEWNVSGSRIYQMSSATFWVGTTPSLFIFPNWFNQCAEPQHSVWMATFLYKSNCNSTESICWICPSFGQTLCCFSSTSTHQPQTLMHKVSSIKWHISLGLPLLLLINFKMTSWSVFYICKNCHCTKHLGSFNHIVKTLLKINCIVMSCPLHARRASYSVYAECSFPFMHIHTFSHCISSWHLSPISPPWQFLNWAWEHTVIKADFHLWQENE